MLQSTLRHPFDDWACYICVLNEQLLQLSVTELEKVIQTALNERVLEPDGTMNSVQDFVYLYARESGVHVTKFSYLRTEKQSPAYNGSMLKLYCRSTASTHFIFIKTDGSLYDPLGYSLSHYFSLGPKGFRVNSSFDFVYSSKIEVSFG